MIRDYWSKLKDYEGVTGRSTMPPDGQADREVFVFQVKGGKFVRVN